MHDSMPGARYQFMAENLLRSIWTLPGGTPLPVADYGYDISGARILKEHAGLGGGGEITLYLRDSSGHVLSAFRPSPTGGTGFLKDYIYSGSQLVAENSQCAPPPYLGLQNPFLVGSQIRFTKTDSLEPISGAHYYMHIRADSGAEKVLDLGAMQGSAQPNFYWPVANF